MKLLEINNIKLLLGQNAKENHLLIDNADPNDWWFHIDNHPSGHCIIESIDINNDRDFIRYFYENATSENDKQQYLILFGDASYDYKDRIPTNNNIVPVKFAFDSFNLASSWVTDDFYVMLDANEGTMSSSHTIDVASSRIPVSTLDEATTVVDKILSYYSKNALGDWRNTITLLADDIDATGEEVLQQGVEKIADEIKTNKPVFNVNKIYLDAFVQQNASGG